MKRADLCSAFVLARHSGHWQSAVVGDGVRWTLPTVVPASGQDVVRALIDVVAELTGGELRLLDPLVPPLLADGLNAPLPWWWVDVHTGADEISRRYEYVVIVESAPTADSSTGVDPAPAAGALRWVDAETLFRLPMAASTRSLGAALIGCADSLAAGRLDAAVLSALDRGLNRPGVGGLPAPTLW